MLRLGFAVLSSMTACSAARATNAESNALDALITPCNDLNSDSVVNVSDLLLLHAAFGTSDAGDTNGDGVTDVADLLPLLGALRQAPHKDGSRRLQSHTGRDAVRMRAATVRSAWYASCHTS